jgi:hypothetical protein
MHLTVLRPMHARLYYGEFSQGHRILCVRPHKTRSLTCYSRPGPLNHTPPIETGTCTSNVASGLLHHSKALSVLNGCKISKANDARERPSATHRRFLDAAHQGFLLCHTRSNYYGPRACFFPVRQSTTNFPVNTHCCATHMTDRQ